MWAWTVAIFLAMVGAGVFIGFASRPPAMLWTFEYQVAGTDAWNDWQMYQDHAACEQERRFMDRLQDHQRRRLVETRPCVERDNPARGQTSRAVPAR